jgi:hypothetical protein
MGPTSASPSASRPILDNLPKLDLQGFRRLGLLRPNHLGTVRWPTNGSGFALVHFMVEADALTLRYQASDQIDQAGPDAVQRVVLTRTGQHVGGERIWLVCPDCHRRCSALCYAGHFRCRRCLGLRYPSQHQPLHERLLYRAQAIRKRLGGSGSMEEPFPGKPKGMRWATYRRLQSQDQALNHRSLLAAAKAFRLPGFDQG